MRKLSALGLSVALGASLLMPVTTFAYLTPDQVFGGPNAAPPPPTQREGEAVVQAQQQAAAEQRQAAQQNLVPVDAPAVDTYVPPTVSSSKGLFDENAQYELRQQRIDEAKASSPTIIIGGNADVRDADGNVLHSGAPLVTSTGPASVLAAIAMMLAAACTFAFAHVRSQKLVLPV